MVVSLTAKQQALQLLNEANDRQFNETHLSFGIPQPYNGEIDRNTSVVVSPVPGASTLFEPVTLYYNRLDLGVMFASVAGGVSLTYDVEYVETHQLLRDINEKFSINLTQEDILNEALNVAPGFPKRQTIRAHINSLGYIGEFQLDLVRPPAIVVVTQPDDDGYMQGWDPDGAGSAVDGRFVFSYDEDGGSRSGEIMVSVRARPASATTAPVSTTITSEAGPPAAGEDLFSFNVDPNAGDWFVDVGVRMGDFPVGSRIEDLYDVRLQFFHSHPDAGTLDYQLEYVGGVYRFRDVVNNHIVPASYTAGAHLVSAMISMKELAATAGWEAAFPEIPLTPFGVPYYDYEVFDGWQGFRITATGRDEPNGQQYIGADVAASAMAQIAPVVPNPWLTPVTAPISNTFTEGFTLLGNWFITNTWAKDPGGQSMRSAAIGHNGSTTMYCDLVDGTGFGLKFDYKTSTEANFDYLRLKVNGVQVWSASGEGLSTYVGPVLGPGPQHIEWIYTKDGSSVQGSDACWVDNIEFWVPPPPAVILPMNRGMLVSHPGGSMVATDMAHQLLLEHVNEPALSLSSWAVLENNGPNEIVAIDGFSASMQVHYSWNGNLDWIKQTFTTHKLVSNSAAWFKGSLYFNGQLRSDNTYGVYRLDRTGTGASAVFSLTKVLGLTDVTGSNMVLASNDQHLCVFEDSGKLYSTTNGTGWKLETIKHPATETNFTMFKVAMTFVGNKLVGMGKHGSFLAPPIICFAGVPGSGSYTYTAIDPWGDNRSWNYTDARMLNVDGALILALSGPTGNTAKILRSTNVGQTWTMLNEDFGIYPVSLADDGVNVFLTGYKEKVGAAYKWQAYSADRGLSFQYDLDSGGFMGSNQDDYTYSTGIKDPNVYTYYLYLMSNLNSGSANYNDLTLGYGRIDARTGENVVLSKFLIGTDQTPGVYVTDNATIATDGKRVFGTFTTTTSYPTSAVHVWTLTDGAMVQTKRWKRTVTDNDVAYRQVAVDPTNDIQWVIEYRQMPASPFTISYALVALRWNTQLQDFVVLGEAIIPNNTKYCCVHNGYLIAYDQSATALRAYQWNGSTVALVATSAAIAGYGSLDGNNPTPVSSDGTHIFLRTGSNTNRDTRFTFSGTTFTEVWRLSAATLSNRHAVSAGDVYARLAVDGSDDGYLNVKRVVGNVETQISTTLRATELMGLAYDPVNKLLLAPTYGGTNTSSAQKSGFSGVYKIKDDNTVQTLSSFLLEEVTPSANNDCRSALWVVPPVKDYAKMRYASMSCFDTTSPYVNLRAWVNDKPLSIDAQPASVGRGGAWAPQGTYYAHPMDAFPYVQIYRVDPGSLMKLANPTGGGNVDIGWSAAFNKDATHLALGHQGNGTTYPYVTIYKRTGDAFARLTGLLDSSTGSLKRVTSISYSADGSLMAAASNIDQGLAWYTVVGDTYTKQALGVTLPTGTGAVCAFSPDGKLLAYMHGGLAAAAPLSVYSVTGTTLAQVFTNTTDNFGNACMFSPDGAYLAAAFSSQLRVYSVVGTTLTLVHSETFTSPGNLSPYFTDTHLMVGVEKFGGAYPSTIRAYTLGTWAYDSTKSLTVGVNDQQLAIRGANGVAALR